MGAGQVFRLVSGTIGTSVDESHLLQTYQWITQYPEMMDLAVPFCGSARTSLHNQVFLEGVKSAMLAAKGESSAGSKEVAMPLHGTRKWSEKEKDVGMKAFGRGYAGW